MDWIKTNLWEIKQSSTLRWFGFLLACAHLITFISWTFQGNLPLKYYSDSIPMCWSAFENCQVLHVFSPTQFHLIYYFFPILALTSSLMFLSLRLYGGGWFFLLLSFLFKLVLYFQDSRLSSNAHYLLTLIQLVYLFVPQKKTILKYLIVSFIVALGSLRLNADWLSGIWLQQQTGLHQKVCEWLAAISTLIELITPWFLVSRKSQNIVLGFFLLIAYFTVYFFVGDGFTSIIFILFLLFYPLYYYEQRRIEMQYLYQSYIRPEASQAWGPLVLLVFWILQALPLIRYHNPRIHLLTEGLALENFASATECHQTSFALFKNESKEILSQETNSRPHRLNCDPFMHFLDIKSYCHTLSKEAGFVNIASSFLVRSLNDKNFQRVFESNNICGSDVNFSNVGKSGWNQNQAN